MSSAECWPSHPFSSVLISMHITDANNESDNKGNSFIPRWPNDAIWRHRSGNIGSGNCLSGTKPSREVLLALSWNVFCGIHPRAISQGMPQTTSTKISLKHDDVIKWKHFPRHWPFVRGIQRSPVNSPHKGEWPGPLLFSLICVWINGWVNNREAGDLRRYRIHYDVIVMNYLDNISFKSPSRQWVNPFNVMTGIQRQPRSN